MQLAPNPALEQFIAELKNAGREWHEPVLSALTEQAQTWQANVESHSHADSAWQLLSYLAPEQRASLNTAQPQVHILLALNDSIACKPSTQGFASEQGLAGLAKDYKDKWRAIWQAFNVLQYLPHFSVATQTGLQTQLFSELLAQRAPFTADSVTAEAIDYAWQDVFEISNLSAEQLQALQGITRSAPEVGADLQNADGVTIATAELAWQHLNVAVFLEDAAQLPELDGWQCISLESGNWLEQLQLALGEQ